MQPLMTTLEIHDSSQSAAKNLTDGSRRSNLTAEEICTQRCLLSRK